MLKNSKLLFRSLLKKRKEEIKESKLYKILDYIKDVYYAKNQTSKTSLIKLKNDYYNRYGQTWQIIKYSRFGEISQFPFPVDTYSTVREQTFKLNLRCLQEHCNVISLYTLAEYLKNNEQPPIGSIVITIDGGTNSAYKYALPLLMDYELPATFAIPTAYIGTKILFWDDTIKLIVELFKNNNFAIPPFKSISEADNKLICETYQNGRPGKDTAQSIIYYFLSLEPKGRMNFMNDLIASLTTKDLKLPEYVDFMAWEDVLDLKKAGFEIISMLHSGIPANVLKIEWLKREIENSISTFSDYELSFPKYISLPLDLFSKNTASVLHEYDIQFCLGGEDAPSYMSQDTPYKILRRRRILDGIMNQENLFLMNLFN